MFNSKKGAVYSVIALMLCVAVYLNWSYSRDGGDVSASGEAGADNKILGEAKLVDGSVGLPESGEAEAGEVDSSVSYFDEARLSRQKARDEAVSILNATIENQNASVDAKNTANKSIETMAQSAMSESRIENLIVAKGYEKCVVFINDNSINVIVNKLENGLKDTDVAKIKDIVISETQVSADKVKIIETDK